MLGTGTQADPFIIQNVTDLQNIENDLSAYYELEGNIDASATSGWNGGEGFIPIGRGATDFSGQLDGKGYTISDLFINMPSDDTIGLFGVLDSGTVLKNISMTGVNITGDTYVGALVGRATGSGEPINIDMDNCNSAGSVSGDYNVGGLIGSWDNGSVDDCWSSCTVTSTGWHAGGLVGFAYAFVTFNNCYATGNVTSTSIPIASRNTGGFVGYFYFGTIENCYTTGAVSGGERVGGFAGTSSDGTINSCSAAGAVTAAGTYGGGFVGFAWGDIDPNTITNCYAKGNVTVTGQYAGGFVGRQRSTGGDVVIDNCYSTGAATGGSSVGGFCGDNTGGTITDCFWDTDTSGQAASDGGTGKSTAQMKTTTTFTDGGWNFVTIWYIDGVTNNGYPALSGGTIIGQSDFVARVSSIRHIYRPGSFKMQVTLGDLGFDVDVAEATVRKELDTAKEVETAPPEIPVTTPPTRRARQAPTPEPTPEPTRATQRTRATRGGGAGAPIPPPEPVQLTQYAKTILATAAGKAAVARRRGLKLGVKAVVTPYAIRVLRDKAAEVKILTDIQRITKAARATGITEYARGVLTRKAAQLKAQIRGSRR